MKYWRHVIWRFKKRKKKRALGPSWALGSFYCGQAASGIQARPAVRDSEEAHIIFTLLVTSINNYTNNEVLIGKGEHHGQTSGLT